MRKFINKNNLGKYTFPAIITILFSGLFSLFASSNPDGLERVAIDAGFMEQEKSYWSFSLFPDYQFPGLSDNSIGNSIVGILGVFIMFGFIWILGKYLTKGIKVVD